MTEQSYKTKEVAQKLHVSPATILKWVKKHDIPYSVNLYGHYCFKEETMSMFYTIKKENQKNNPSDLNHKEVVSSQYVMDRLATTEEKVQILERMIGNKADDIVTFQLVEHRKKVEKLNKRIQKLEEKLDNLQPKEEKKSELEKDTKKSRRLIPSLFLFD
ncbi:chromosome-anchoring protein RacA [Salibacterium salarium]|uniref:helix-turn-helix domain-containing protein n=1 Tax=Salibacterium salarium TaxID=284579 RepID=UPI0027849C54|nr:helix-turn-helix domain-containing protein [Salibacterium salarium]MDQ0299396.1 chromosome-anchoring protein RacA [Salibacterium salarium]